MARKPTRNAEPLHERYNPAHPLLRELVYVHVDTPDREPFDALLTRVPSIGEEITKEADQYKILRVQHQMVNDDGRAYLGYHAWIDAKLLPPESEEVVSIRRRDSKPRRPRNAASKRQCNREPKVDS